MVVKLIAPPDTRLLKVEDNKPVDSQYIEKQQRLLVETLQSSWTSPGGKPFMANADVGLFFADDAAHPLVPDVMLTLDVPYTDIKNHDHRSFFVWIVGKVPDVVIEIVSPKPAGEDGKKLRKYQKRGIPNYVVYDPDRRLGPAELRVFRLIDGKYRPNTEKTFPELGLGLTIWPGEYEQYSSTWLRWCDLEGAVIPTGREGRIAAKRIADKAKKAKQAETLRADAAEEENRLLKAKLRELGVEL